MFSLRIVQCLLSLLNVFMPPKLYNNISIYQRIIQKCLINLWAVNPQIFSLHGSFWPSIFIVFRNHSFLPSKLGLKYSRKSNFIYLLKIWKRKICPEKGTLGKTGMIIVCLYFLYIFSIFIFDKLMTWQVFQKQA